MRLENLKIYFCNILTTPSEAQTKIGLTNEKKHQKNIQDVIFSWWMLFWVWHQIRLNQNQVTWSEATNYRHLGTFLISPAVNWNSSRLITLSPFWKKSNTYNCIYIFLTHNITKIKYPPQLFQVDSIGNLFELNLIFTTF